MEHLIDLDAVDQKTDYRIITDEAGTDGLPPGIKDKKYDYIKRRQCESKRNKEKGL